MAFELTYKTFGECAILVEWPSRIDTVILKDILSFKHAIEQDDIKDIVEIKYAYNSLLIVYNSFCRNFENNINLLKNLYSKVLSKSVILSNLWRIPVCYDASFGIDLDFISKEKKMPISKLVQLHSQVVYTVYFIGFLPGFLYLGGLDDRLYIPRKSTPRLRIEKGAVAIGGHQTGVYPSPSPGGWNIIGNSPIEFFNPRTNPPCFAQAGDRICFYPISLKEHADIKILSEAGVYQLESEVFND